MNVLLIGSGGREHALAWAIKKSPKLSQLYCAPGNAGITELAEIVDLDTNDHDAVVAFCRSHTIEFVVVGPEAPLVAGLTDRLTMENIAHFGPSQAAAQLEGSKGFTKDLCKAHNIPTAAFGRFTDAASAKAYRTQQNLPIVIKADGLAAGKGVTIAETTTQADSAIDACFSGTFGDAGSAVVIEEFLHGEEASFFALCDGTHAVPLASAQDHKRVGDGDTGPNTGGMGAYSPAPVMTDAMVKQTMTRIIQPTVDAMAERGTPFKGVLFAGLMITESGPQLIEYNVRFGDPEVQVLVLRMNSDLLEAMVATSNGTLDKISFDWLPDSALTIVMAAEGYPGTPQKGSIIRGIEEARDLAGVEVFHAGTRVDGENIVANGGRVLNVTARAPTVSQAQALAYSAIRKIHWPEGFYRSDIGWRAVERERS